MRTCTCLLLLLCMLSASAQRSAHLASRMDSLRYNRILALLRDVAALPVNDSIPLRNVRPASETAVLKQIIDRHFDTAFLRLNRREGYPNIYDASNAELVAGCLLTLRPYTAEPNLQPLQVWRPLQWAADATANTLFALSAYRYGRRWDLFLVDFESGTDKTTSVAYGFLNADYAMQAAIQSKKAEFNDRLPLTEMGFLADRRDTLRYQWLSAFLHEFRQSVTDSSWVRQDSLTAPQKTYFTKMADRYFSPSHLWPLRMVLTDTVRKWGLYFQLNYLKDLWQVVANPRNHPLEIWSATQADVDPATGTLLRWLVISPNRSPSRHYFIIRFDGATDTTTSLESVYLADEDPDLKTFYLYPYLQSAWKKSRTADIINQPSNR